MIIGLIRTRLNRAKNRVGREILPLTASKCLEFFDISSVVVSAANMVSSATRYTATEIGRGKRAVKEKNSIIKKDDKKMGCLLLQPRK